MHRPAQIIHEFLLRQYNSNFLVISIFTNLLKLHADDDDVDVVVVVDGDDDYDDDDDDDGDGVGDGDGGCDGDGDNDNNCAIISGIGSKPDIWLNIAHCTAAMPNFSPSGTTRTSPSNRK